MPDEVPAAALAAVVAPLKVVVEGAGVSFLATPSRAPALHDGVAPPRRGPPPDGQVGPVVGHVHVVAPRRVAIEGASVASPRSFRVAAPQLFVFDLLLFVRLAVLSVRALLRHLPLHHEGATLPPPIFEQFSLFVVLRPLSSFCVRFAAASLFAHVVFLRLLARAAE